jgi:predicted nucleic acid-binding protein
MKVLIDTNLIIRLSNPSPEPSSEVAQQSIDLLRKQGFDLTLVPQVIYEFWAVATRPLSANGLGMVQQEAKESIVNFTDLFSIDRDERGIYQHWMALIDKYDISGKTTHDARLVAAMVRHRIDRLLTFNAAHFARFDEIEVWTPEAVVAGGHS